MIGMVEQFGVALALVGFASIMPAKAVAQCPMHLSQWGSHGRGNGEFVSPAGMVVNGAGNFIVAIQ